MFRTTRYIKEYVEEFIRFAMEHSEYIFLVTEIGCGIAGFSPREIAPLFKDAIPVEIFTCLRILEVLYRCPFSAKADWYGCRCMQ